MGARLFEDEAKRLAPLLQDLQLGPRAPNYAELQAMLEVAFWASLEREEGVPITVAVAFADRSEERSLRAVQSFAAPTPLTVREVRKLALATDPWRSFIAVDAADEGYEIWGVYIGHRLRLEPFGWSGSTGHAVVRATGPGVIELSHPGAGQIWINERGEPLEPPHWTFTSHIFARALAAVPGDWRTLVLLWLARRVAQAGHGGMFAIVDSERLDYVALPDERHLSPPLRALDPLYQAYRAAAVSTLEEDPTPETASIVSLTRNDTKWEALARLMDELDGVAQLASVDGAVVLAREGLAVLGFSAMLKATPVEPKVLIGMPRGRDLESVALSRLGGSRHQSAAKWCDAYGPSGFVVVASQDGVVSFVRKVGDSVLFLRPLRLADEDEGLAAAGAPYSEPQDAKEFLKGPAGPAASTAGRNSRSRR